LLRKPALVFATLLAGCSGGVSQNPPGALFDAAAFVDGAPPSAADDAGLPQNVDATTGEDASPIGSPADASSDATGDAAEGGFVPATCVDLSGHFQMNADDMVLTRASCGSLTWVRSPLYGGTGASWTHVYTTDGVARATADETNSPCTEQATVDGAAMHVVRTYPSGVVQGQRVYWSTHPCTLYNPDGAYLVRETLDANGTQTACDYWALVNQCPAGTKECDGDPSTVCETNIGGDPSHCGDCNVTCPSGANETTVACVSGACTTRCVPGFADCDNYAGDGCEANLSSTSSCGACNVVCSTAGTANAACLNGGCVESCDSSHLDCNGSPNDGCETAIDGLDCGVCGNDCKGGACVAGKCATVGTSLVTGIASAPTLAVDGTYLYYLAGNGLYAVDKVKGGTPLLVANDADVFAAGGDGSVYYVSTTMSVMRWTPSSTKVIATYADGSLYNGVGIVADAAGAVWSEPATTGLCNLYSYGPSDSAPRLLYASTASSPACASASAVNGASAYGWIGSGLYRFPRAGGAPVLLAATSGQASQVVATSTYVYGSNGATITRYATDPAGAPPGGTIWYSASGGMQGLTTDGTSLFTLGAVASGSDVDQLSEDDLPTIKTVAFASAAYAYGYGSGLAADAQAVYVWDGTKQEIRRVAR
jgi:hypothetical protein